ncbi:transposase [Novosphingobium sp. Chol11]|uniref:transposase n=1 Tax=Novosphingobium sp. Chol11 TaxID=1385763 RepID=UPI0020D24B37|nr:transposase [Novosphingobium sp. Chol11]
MWRAVDHAGGILENYVTRSRDKAAALTFMKKALKRHGSPKASPLMASEAMGRDARVWQSSKAGSRSLGQQAWETITRPSEDGNGRCCASGS